MRHRFDCVATAGTRAAAPGDVARCRHAPHELCQRVWEGRSPPDATSTHLSGDDGVTLLVRYRDSGAAEHAAAGGEAPLPPLPLAEGAAVPTELDAGERAEQRAIAQLSVMDAALRTLRLATKSASRQDAAASQARKRSSLSAATGAAPKASRARGAQPMARAGAAPESDVSGSEDDEDIRALAAYGADLLTATAAFKGADGGANFGQSLVRHYRKRGILVRAAQLLARGRDDNGRYAVALMQRTHPRHSLQRRRSSWAPSLTFTACSSRWRRWAAAMPCPVGASGSASRACCWAAATSRTVPLRSCAKSTRSCCCRSRSVARRRLPRVQRTSAAPAHVCVPVAFCNPVTRLCLARLRRRVPAPGGASASAVTKASTRAPPQLPEKLDAQHAERCVRTCWCPCATVFLR